MQGPILCGLGLLMGLVSVGRGAWVNFDTWEDRKSYDVFSHYNYIDYNYRNPVYTNSPYFFETLPATTETATPRFFKRQYQRFRAYLNKTVHRHSLPARFDRFDKHHIIRKTIRQIQKFLYLNAPEERIEWFNDPDSSAHLAAMTFKNEPYWADLGWKGYTGEPYWEVEGKKH